MGTVNPEMDVDGLALEGVIGSRLFKVEEAFLVPGATYLKG